MSSSLDRVAYKPLGTSSGQDMDMDDAELNDDQQDTGTEGLSSLRHNYRFKYHHHASASTAYGGYGFRQLRILLYIVASLLFLLFLVQFSTNERPSESKSHTQQSSTAIAAKFTSLPRNPQDGSGQHRDNGEQITRDTHDERLMSSSDVSQPRSPTFQPEYDGYLTSVLRERNEQGIANASDDLRIPLDDSSSGRWWRMGTRDNGNYITVTNYIRAMKSFNYNASVTLTTQATTEFMYHTLELCKRWDGPISAAIYCPGVEKSIAISLIKFMRQCLPSPLSACIRDKVSWHLVYNKDHGPVPSSLGYPAQYVDSEHYSLFANQDLCPKFSGPDPSDSIRQFEEQLKLVNKVSPLNYRQRSQLLYPINVLRNAARLAANTKYVLASDIELYPSINLVPLFINYNTKHHNTEIETNQNKVIFTLPIFEVRSNVTAPKVKSELVELFERGDAVFFHKYVCDWCQNFPNRLAWLQTDRFGEENNHEELNEIAIFERTQRDKTRNSWEPIFIGTNEDPLYDDRLTWEGRRDKMGQMYEMCLKDYRLFVLGNAFLVHTPGIKHIDKEDNRRRLKFMISNNAIYDETVKKLARQYANSSTINKC